MLDFVSSLSVTWTLVALFSTLLIVYGIWPNRYFKNLGIPGPTPLPFFGSLLSYKKGFYNFDMQCFKTYGRIWGVFEGRQPMLMVTDTELIKAVMIKEFYSTFTNRRDVSGFEGPLSDGVSVVKDEKWRRIRTSLSPLFSSGKLREMFPVVDRYADRLIDSLKKKNLEAVAVKEMLGPYSMDVITSVSFSVETDSINNPKDPFLINIKKIIDISPYNLILWITVLFPSSARWLNKIGLTVFSKSAMMFFASAFKKIKEQHPTDQNGQIDFLKLMIQSQITDEQAQQTKDGQHTKGLTDNEIMSQSFIFTLGGFETTSTTITYLLYNLATNPDAKRRLVEEIDATFPEDTPITHDAVMNLEYLDMAMNESLRLLPTAPRLERGCKQTVQINGVTIGKEVLVGIPVFVLHRDPQIWPSPEEFRPERFSREGKADLNPYAFLPFGMGPRNCIGMRFAVMVMKTVVVKLLQEFDLETSKETQIPLEMDVFFRPKVPITLQLVPRSR